VEALTSWIRLDFEGHFLWIGKVPIDLQIIYTNAMKIVSSLIILFIMYITIRIGNTIIHKFMKKQAESNLSFSMDKRKAETI
jgi:hypothetical protein